LEVLVKKDKDISMYNLQNLGPYLAGIIEGDGVINVPQTLRDSKNRKRYPSIRICFAINDLKLSEHLQSILGGSILINKNKTYIIYSIQKHDELVTWVNLINGYFRTPKIEALHRLINFFNDNNLVKVYFELKNIDESKIDSNSWLTGFSDADGNFNINISKRKNTMRIQLSFRIEQKQLTNRLINDNLGSPSYINICLKIAKYFNVSLYTRTRKLNDKEFLMYLIVTHNSESHRLVCDYFQKYPLLSSKHLNYLDWSIIYYLQKEKKHLTPEGYSRCIEIKNRFNNKRTRLNWDHLLLNFLKLLN
jgi:hypothetical protein